MRVCKTRKSRATGRFFYKASEVVLILGKKTRKLMASSSPPPISRLSSFIELKHDRGKGPLM